MGGGGRGARKGGQQVRARWPCICFGGVGEVEVQSVCDKPCGLAGYSWWSRQDREFFLEGGQRHPGFEFSPSSVSGPFSPASSLSL